VEEDTGKVVPACLQSVQLTIEHVCDCCQRVPVFRVNVGKCPGNVGEVEATGDSCVLIDVARIVVVNEVVPECLTKNRPR
jgi:hypothetical protein